VIPGATTRATTRATTWPIAEAPPEDRVHPIRGPLEHGWRYVRIRFPTRFERLASFVTRAS
jgi:hypothetical protein